MCCMSMSFEYFCRDWCIHLPGLSRVVKWSWWTRWSRISDPRGKDDRVFRVRHNSPNCRPFCGQVLALRDFIFFRISYCVFPWACWPPTPIEALMMGLHLHLLWLFGTEEFPIIPTYLPLHNLCTFTPKVQARRKKKHACNTVPLQFGHRWRMHWQSWHFGKSGSRWVGRAKWGADDSSKLG